MDDWTENNCPGIDWVIERTDPNRGSWSIKSRHKYWDVKDPSEKFPVFYCKVCEYAWEVIRNYSKKVDIKIKKYSDFPKMGLKEVACPTCNQEEQHKGTRVQCIIK